jgi:HlyD family secretion protein
MSQLLVKEGDKVKARQVIPILVNRPCLQAADQEAQAAVKIAQITLEKVKSGAKIGEIEAQETKIARM